MGPKITLPTIRLSQGHLNLLATCPRKFQHVFLEQLSAPQTPEQQEKLVQGSRFHLLLQQWQLGLPVQLVVQEDPKIQGWFSNFVQATPRILGLDPSVGETMQQSEHQRTLEFQGYLLTVIYDLLITNWEQAKILDWKTYPRPQFAHWLTQNWQSRLYPFVLAETSPYSPAQISMVYWFFQTQAGDNTSPQSLTLRYDRAQHERTRHALIDLLDQLTGWLENYQKGHPFPQVSGNSQLPNSQAPTAQFPTAKSCESCNFAVRCGRVTMQTGDRPPSPASPPSFPNFSSIPEIPI
jgi:hypothetical protein